MLWYVVVFTIGLWVGYALWLLTDWSHKRDSRQLKNQLRQLELKVDLIIEGLESIVEPKTD